jgi:hypothetical protein
MRNEKINTGKAKSEITIRRPNGTIETVTTKFDYITDAFFAQIKKANLQAGTGECLSYKNIPAQKIEAAKVAEATIKLSTRGFGEYSPVAWTGDINRTDAEIIAECKDLLAKGHDVDNRNQSDDEILAKIKAERERIATADEKEAARKRDLEKYEEHRAKMKRVMGY